VRIVVDTNVLVSRFLSPSGAPARVFAAWEREEVELLVSGAILAEYGRVLAYERLRAYHRLDDEAIARIVADLGRFATLVEVTERLAVVAADPDDNMFVECAVAGGAAYIVSGDPHLRGLGEFRGIQILSPAEFLAFLAHERGESP
jgi:uncharacterized protein